MAQKIGSLIEPEHDKEVIDESAAPITTVVTYYQQNKVVGIKTIEVSGAITTITVVLYA